MLMISLTEIHTRNQKRKESDDNTYSRHIHFFSKKINVRIHGNKKKVKQILEHQLSSEYLHITSRILLP